MYAVSTYHHGNLRSALIEEGLVLLEEGKGEISLRELARRVGVSANASYRHFANKDALLAALAAEGFQRLQHSQRELEDTVDGSERMIAAGRNYLRFAYRHPALFRLMFGETSEQPAGLKNASRAAYCALKESVVASNGISPEEAEAVALRAWALVHGLSHLLLSGFFDGQSQAPLELAESALQPN